MSGNDLKARVCCVGWVGLIVNGEVDGGCLSPVTGWVAARLATGVGLWEGSQLIQPHLHPSGIAAYRVSVYL